MRHNVWHYPLQTLPSPSIVLLSKHCIIVQVLYCCPSIVLLSKYCIIVQVLYYCPSMVSLSNYCIIVQALLLSLLYFVLLNATNDYCSAENGLWHPTIIIIIIIIIIIYLHSVLQILWSMPLQDQLTELHFLFYMSVG